jgi:hypothetical protein
MKVQIEVTQQNIEDVLISGFEGGSNYWLLIRNDKTPLKGDYIKTLFESGMAVQDEISGKEYKLTKRMVKRGVKIMAQKYPQHFSDMMRESFDATTGDVLLQCAVLGDVIYG